MTKRDSWQGVDQISRRPGQDSQPPERQLTPRGVECIYCIRTYFVIDAWRRGRGKFLPSAHQDLDKVWRF